MTKPFERVLIVMFENQYRSYVMQDPFMQKLARAGADMTNYFGAFHPSQTNYVASLAGEVCAVTNDTPPAIPLKQQTMVDLLEAKGVSWKAYMEAYPNEPWNPVWAQPSYSTTEQPVNEYPTGTGQLARYFRKHNAFASFQTIQSKKERWEKIVDEFQFWDDIYGDGLPQYSWFTPDIWNDGHYLYNTHVDTNPRTQLVPQLSGWLEHVFLGNIATSDVPGVFPTGMSHIGLNLDVDLLLTDPQTAYKQSNIPSGTLVVITFDEADFNATGYDTNYDGQNQIYTVLLGDMIEPFTQFDPPYNHYSLMRTIEKNFDLGHLGKNDTHANWIRNLWGEHFSWSKAKHCGLTGLGMLASASFQGKTWLILEDQTEPGMLLSSTFDGTSWSEEVFTGLDSIAYFDVTAVNGQLLMLVSDMGGQLGYSTNSGDGWSSVTYLDVHSKGELAVMTYYDIADDGKEKAMACYRNEQGWIHTAIYADNGWSGIGAPTGQLTDGPITLGQLGGSLFLVFKERGTRQMRMASYNVAPYNAFDAVNFQGAADPNNNTSLHAWSPCDFPVGNFANKMNAVENQYQSLGSQLAMASITGEMHLATRGGYDDTPQVFGQYFGLTGIFTAENQLTNGYGTIDQAGWTVPVALDNVEVGIAGGMTMSSDGEKLVLVWQNEETAGELMYCTGGYRT